jgi:SsrA-binding protein
MMERETKPVRLICQNKKARHDYEIVETIEAGIALKGTEVKSLRMGKANLKDSYARIKNGEVYLIGTHISPYPYATYNNHAPLRDRKLLLKRQEIRKLIGKTKEKGLTLIPLRLYFKGGIVKVELALAKGKRLFDKRETLRRKTMEREAQRALMGAKRARRE